MRSYGTTQDDMQTPMVQQSMLTPGTGQSNTSYLAAARRLRGYTFYLPKCEKPCEHKSKSKGKRTCSP